ncbi:unnamed protein product [Scytosiphon promiscuus]
MNPFSIRMIGCYFAPASSTPADGPRLPCSSPCRRGTADRPHPGCGVPAALRQCHPFRGCWLVQTHLGFWTCATPVREAPTEPPAMEAERCPPMDGRNARHGHRSPTPAGGNLLFLGWRAESPDDSMAPPAEIAKANALEIGLTAWEGGASHRWPIFLAENQEVPGRVSVEVDAHLPGPQPHVAQLLEVFPRRPFDFERDSDVGVAKGVQ